MTKMERHARLNRIRELIRELRAITGTRENRAITDVLELMADLVERS
jgi:hypothetical protein